MQRKPASLRNKLMVACALVAACMLAAPAAFAHDGRYRHSHDDGARLLGALVVGAVVGGVLVSASQNHHDYYSGGYYYPPQRYPSGYYGGYPVYPYGNAGYAYPRYGYGSSVNIGVVYSNRGDRTRYRYDHGRRYYGGSSGYYDGGYRGHRSSGRYDSHRHGSRGHYYQRDHD